MEHRQQLIVLDHLSQVGMDFGHPPTHKGRNVRQRIFIWPYDAWKGSVGAKCRPFSWFHRHTGSDDFIWWEPNEMHLACRMFRPILLSRRRRTVTTRGEPQQQQAEEGPARCTQSAARVRMALASFCTSAGRNDHTAHLSFSLN
jgi:hypothetical protein